MKFSFKKIDKESFIRIWDSDFKDSFPDSHKKPFKESKEEEWKPLLDKHLKVMQEVEIENELVGYVFLSPKEDGSAHLGYGVYENHRGKGYSVEMCRQFLINEIPKLENGISKILGTTLESNIVSQKVLKKLGFKLIGKLDDPEFNYIIFERDIKIHDFERS